MDPHQNVVTVEIDTKNDLIFSLIRRCEVKVKLETPFNQQNWTVCSGSKVNIWSSVVKISMGDRITNMASNAWQLLILSLQENIYLQLFTVKVAQPPIFAKEPCGSMNIKDSGVIKFNITTYIDCEWKLQVPSDKYLVIDVKHLDLAITERQMYQGVHQCMCGGHKFIVTTPTYGQESWCGYTVPTHLIYTLVPNVKISISGLPKAEWSNLVARKMSNLIPALPSIGTLAYTMLDLKRNDCNQEESVLLADVNKTINIKGPFLCQWLCLSRKKDHVLDIIVTLDHIEGINDIEVKYCELNSTCKKVVNKNNIFHHTIGSGSCQIMIAGIASVSLTIKVSSLAQSGCGGPYLLQV